jgi:hypothetical protein
MIGRKKKKAAEPKPSFDPLQLLMELVPMMQRGEIPQGDDVRSCITRTLIAALEVFMTTESKFATELERLLRAFANANDPMLEGIGTLEYAGLMVPLNMLRKTREAALAKAAETTGTG